MWVNTQLPPILIWSYVSTEKKYSSKYEYKYKYEYSIPAYDMLRCRGAVRIITGMDRNAPEWASITGMDIKINVFYATKFIILP